MTEVVDLTFTDSDDETQPRTSLPVSAPAAAATAAGGGGMRTPLRRLLALQRQNTALEATEAAQATSPEAIDLLESPEPALLHRYHPSPKRKPIDPEPGPIEKSQQPRQNKKKRSLPDPATDYEYDYGNGFPREESVDPEYDPYTSTQDAPPVAAGRGRKPKRTREEIARDKEVKKQRKAAETAARKLASQYNSDRHVLRYMTVILDPELMGSPIGVKVLEAFQQTQAQQAEHERISYKVASTCLGGGLKAIKWLRKIPTLVSQSQQQQLPDATAGPSNYNSTGGDSIYPSSLGGSEQQQQQQQTLVDQEEPHILICYEAADFIAAVQHDGLVSLFTRLESHCPGHRPHILVHRLDQCLTKKEREDFKQTMGAAGAGGNNSLQNSFNRRDIDDFISKLAIEAPHVGFRDVGSAEEGAGHVCSLTRAISRLLLEKNDANKYLLSTAVGNNKKSTQNTASLLASYPVEDAGVRSFITALCAMPSVGPQIAHAVAVKYGSLGSLMEMLFDPGKSYAEKIRELEFLSRTGSGRATKVGPKAAKQLIEILTGENPDAPVHAT